MLIGPDGPVAGHEHQALVNGLFQAGRKTDLDHLFDNLDNQRFNLFIFKQGRDRFYYKSIAAKGFYFQPQFLKIRNQPFKNLRFSVSKVNGFRDKEFLGCFVCSR